MVSTVIGALIVEEGRRSAATGRLTTLRSVIVNISFLVGGPVSGLLATRYGPTGGLRMAAEMVHPSTAQFLDQMMRDGRNFRFEDVVTGPGAAGRAFSEFKGSEGNCPLVVAVKNAAGTSYEINPPGSRQVKDGDVFVVIGSPIEVKNFRARVA